MIEVRESPLHGRGLFATQFIAKDTLLGWLLTEPARDDEHDSPYVLWIDGTRPLRVTCDFRFINHSSDPNAAYFDDLSVMSLRDIQPGEEILHDYTGGSDDPEMEVDFDDAGESAQCDQAGASDELLSA